jgi:hypothetical protein
MSNGFDWNAIKGTQLKLLLEAMVSDFTMDTLSLALVAELGRDPLANYSSPVHPYPIQAFQLLQAAKRQGWVRELIDGLIASNQGGPGLRRFRATVGLTADIGKPAPAGWQLEDLLREDPDFLKPDGWLTKLAALRGRVCRIEHSSRPADKPGFGTGWLVGPDLVLTNYHVIQAFKPVAASGLEAGEITCRFDVPESPEPGASRGRECKLAPNWLVDGSRPGEAERDEGTAPPTDAELDYALIRLAERAGEDKTEKTATRGWVDLGSQGKAPRNGDVLLIVQHPEGLPQRFAFGNVVNKPDTSALRLLHDANTLKGSSGSPVVDIKLDIIALHHAGGQANQAVPIEQVAKRLTAQGML